MKTYKERMEDLEKEMAKTLNRLDYVTYRMAELEKENIEIKKEIAEMKLNVLLLNVNDLIKQNEKKEEVPNPYPSINNKFCFNIEEDDEEWQTDIN